MAKIKFYYTNLWKDYDLVETSEHENFVVENTQNRSINKRWQSQNGAGSGWGNFNIEASVNDRLDFKDSVSATYAASLTVAEYTADELASHIKTQLEATATSDTFTVEYLEVSNKFKITNNSGSFELLWNTGTNKARSVADTIGFDDSADDTGAVNYTADNLRIHSEERVSIDLGATTGIYAVIIRGHNFGSGATVKAQFSADDWSTVADTNSFTVQDDIMILEWDSPKSYRYVRIWIEDKENSDLYVSMGVVFIGTHFQPVTNFLEGREIEDIDPSEIITSEHGQESSIQLDDFEGSAYLLQFNGSDELANFLLMKDAVKTSIPLFVCEDPSVPLTTTKYVRFTSWRRTFLQEANKFGYITLGYIEMR